MTRDDIRATVLRLRADRAPEVDFSQIHPDRPLRDQIDLDSMDYLNFLIALHKELGITIPDKDYPKLATLNGGVDDDDFHVLSRRLRLGARVAYCER